MSLRVLVGQWAQFGRTLAYVGNSNSKSRAQLSGSLMNSRNFLSPARKATTARGYKYVLQQGCNARGWLRICVSSGVCSLFVSLSTIWSPACQPSLCGYSFYTLEVFDVDKYQSVGFRIEWRKQKVIFDGIKNKEGAFTIGGIEDVAVVHVVGWSELCVDILKAWNNWDQGIRSVEVVLNKEIVVDGAKHLGPIHFMCLVIHIHLRRMQKTKRKVGGVVFLINTIRGNISRGHCVEIIVLTTGESEEVIREMPESLREPRVSRGVKAL